MHNNKKWFETIGEFMGHVFVGALIYMVIALATAGLALFNRWLEPCLHGYPMNVLHVAENILATGDVGLFIVWVAVSFARAVKELVS